MKITNKLTIHLDEKRLIQPVDAVQRDVGRRVEVSLYTGGAKWNIPDGATIAIRYRRPDGVGGAYDTLPDGTSAWSVSDNIAAVELAEYVLAVPGQVTLQIAVLKDSSVISTFSIPVRVEADPSAKATPMPEKPTLATNNGSYDIALSAVEGGYTADKTLAEINAAYEAGRELRCVVPVDDGTALVPLVNVINDGGRMTYNFGCTAAGMAASDGVSTVTVSLFDNSGELSVNVKIDKSYGEPGADGKDYVLTEADKAEITAMVLNSLGGNPVFGYVDEDNNIIVSGNLPDGTYSVKYEMEDGATVNIGNLVLDTNVYYTVTNALTNCTNSNSAAQAVQGGSYSATITANSGYELSSVKVTMGGTDISATAVSGGKITISNVTGNIVITAAATEVQTGPAYTNLLPLSVDASDNDYRGLNNEDGYKAGYRLSKSANGEEVEQTGMYCTGFMPAVASSTIRIKNITEYSANTGWNLVLFYDSSKAYIGSATLLEANASMNFNNGLYTFRPSSFTGTESTAFIRFACGGISDETIVTVNEEIA